MSMDETIPPGLDTVSDAILTALWGPLKIIEQLRPSYGRRYRRWLADLPDRYMHEIAVRRGSKIAGRSVSTRSDDNGARAWLMAQVLDPRLPDLRRGKSATDDEVLLKRLSSLHEALAPVFRDTKGSPQTRLKRIEPIVSEVLGQPWKPTHTLTGKEPLLAFCYGVLGVSAARMSQLRRRYLGACYERFEKVITQLEAVRAAGDDRRGVRNLIAKIRRYQQAIPIKNHRHPKPKVPRVAE